MKKYFKWLMATLVVAVCAFVFAACGNGGETSSATQVKGKTYVYSDIEITYTETATEDLKTTINANVEASKNYITAMYVTFNEDGTVDNGSATKPTYTQSGDTVTVTEGSNSIEYKVEGSKLTYTSTLEKAGYTQTTGLGSVKMILVEGTPTKTPSTDNPTDTPSNPSTDTPAEDGKGGDTEDNKTEGSEEGDENGEVTVDTSVTPSVGGDGETQTEETDNNDSEDQSSENQDAGD